MHITHHGDHLLATGYGPGAEVVLGDVPELVGLRAPGVEQLEPHHEAVARAQKRLAGYRQGRSGQVFSRLVAAVLAQKASGANSKPALRMLACRWGERAPGPRDDLQLLPEPSALASVACFHFHSLGVEGQRARRVPTWRSSQESVPGPLEW